MTDVSRTSTTQPPPPPPSSPTDRAHRPMTSLSDRNRRLQWKGTLWLAVILIPLLGLMAFASRQKYQDAVEKAALQTRNLSKILALQLEADFNRTDRVLKYAEHLLNSSLPDGLGSPPAELRQQQPVLNHKLQDLDKHFPTIKALNFFDAEGNLRFSSHNSTTINIADRAFFQRLKNNPQAQTAFSNIVISRTTGLRGLIQARCSVTSRADLWG